MTLLVYKLLVLIPKNEHVDYHSIGRLFRDIRVFHVAIFWWFFDRFSCLLFDRGIFQISKIKVGFLRCESSCFCMAFKMFLLPRFSDYPISSMTSKLVIYSVNTLVPPHPATWQGLVTPRRAHQRSLPQRRKPRRMINLETAPLTSANPGNTCRHWRHCRHCRFAVDFP